MSLNPIFRAPKTRRLVSAWMLRGTAGEAVATVTRFRDVFDQVVFMCGGVKVDGSLPADWPLAERRELAARLRDMGISVLNDYGGTWKEAGAALSSSPRAAVDLAERMAGECDATGADGVDIDFEHWPAEGRFIYTDLIRRLSETLHVRNKMLSLCVYALSAEARREVGIGFWDTSVLAGYADHLRAMVYDLYCPPSLFVGPTSTAPWGRETMTYMASQVPRHKIVMGLPTYSVDWDINDPTKSSQVNDYQWIAAREKESPIGRGWCYHWDVNLIRYSDAAGHAHLLWVSDARSTRSHLVTVDSLDLAGVCFWVLGGEDPAIWEAVRDHFQR